MGKIIACMNEKGGVAKTTTVKNASVGFAMEGKKVLAIDLDPSASLSKSLGVSPAEEKGTICSILDYSIDCEEIPDGCGIVHQEEGIDIITSSRHMRAYESKLMETMQRELVLQRYVYSIRDKYDYILIDCLAGLGIFVTNALFCADALIIPVEPQFLAASAMQNLFVNIAQVRKLNGTHRRPEILGGLFSKVRTNTNNDKFVMEKLKKTSGTGIKYFNTYIPHLVAFSESDAACQSIYRYAKNSAAAMIYSDLVKEILEIEKNG